MTSHLHNYDKCNYSLDPPAIVTVTPNFLFNLTTCLNITKPSALEINMNFVCCLFNLPATIYSGYGYSYTDNCISTITKWICKICGPIIPPVK
jgi:hypothetical protein